jgi:hypothetical protein
LRLSFNYTHLQFDLFAPLKDEKEKWSTDGEGAQYVGRPRGSTYPSILSTLLLLHQFINI